MSRRFLGETFGSEFVVSKEETHIFSDARREKECSNDVIFQRVVPSSAASTSPGNYNMQTLRSYSPDCLQQNPSLGSSNPCFRSSKTSSETVP